MTTYYLLDGDEEIAEYSSGGIVLRRYITGPVIDDRIARVEGNGLSSPPKYYYHVNHQGSVIAMTDSTGAITQKLSYDEYGNLTSEPPAVGTGEQYRYTGRRYDEETKLYYYRARYYSPVLGRFLQTDPIGYGDDLNLYSYVANNPVNASDPYGLQGKENDDANKTCTGSIIRGPNCDNSPFAENDNNRKEVGDVGDAPTMATLPGGYDGAPMITLIRGISQETADTMAEMEQAAVRESMAAELAGGALGPTIRLIRIQLAIRNLITK